MIVLLGLNKMNGFKVAWVPTEVINPHWLFVGVTGSGKTYRLRHAIEQLQRFNVQIHVFDCHGDLDLSPAFTSTAKFSETSDIGINPFKVNPDLDFGGVRRKIISFISMVNRYSQRALGDRQEAVLRNLIEELYREYSYEIDKPQTWDSTGKTVPTLEDLKNYTYGKIGEIMFGRTGDTFNSMDDVNEKLSLLMEAAKSKFANETGLHKLEEECKAAFDKMVKAVGDRSGFIATDEGQELANWVKYASKDVLKTLYHRIETLYSMGVFKNKPASFHGGKRVWRYDITSLTSNEAGFIVETYLEKIFLAAKQRGIVKVVDTFVVIDEAQKFMSKEEGHIINVVIKEGRKFGVGLIFASQNFSHFTDDVLTNTATKVILGVDEQEHATLSRKLGIKPLRLKYIKPKKTALVQIKGSGEKSNNSFVETLL